MPSLLKGVQWTSWKHQQQAFKARPQEIQATFGMHELVSDKVEYGLEGPAP